MGKTIIVSLEFSNPGSATFVGTIFATFVASYKAYIFNA
jgi:hypothetical protein